MASEGDNVHPIEDPRRIERLLAVLRDCDVQGRPPAERLALEVDGAPLASVPYGAGAVTVRVPPRARSLTVRDERDRVRGFVLLDELAAEPCVLDGGRLLLVLERDEERITHLTLSANELDLGGAVGAQPLAGAQSAVPASVPGPDDAGTPGDHAEPTEPPLAGPRPAVQRWLLAASVVLLVGLGASSYLGYRSYQQTQARIAAQQAEQQRLEAEQERLRRAKDQSDERVATLIDELKAAQTEAERARIVAQLDAERAAAAKTGAARPTVGAKPGSSSPAKAACKPGDPLCESAKHTCQPGDALCSDL